jgi:hypothetical protein
MSTQDNRTVTTRAKKDLVYVHEYGDGKKQKTVELRLLAAPKGIVRWLAPDPETGLVPRPGPDNFDDFLELAVHPDDALKLAEAIVAGTMYEDARYDAAMTGWKNSMGERDYLSIAARIGELQAQAERLEVLVEDAQATSEDEDDINPLDD